MTVVNITGGKLKGITQLNLDGSNDLVEHILEGQVRVVTETLKGSTAAFPSTYAYGEVWELRYSNAFTASQFQGMFLRVANTVANTGTLRGMEVDARNASGLNAGELVGVHGTASVKGAGTITGCYGISGNCSVDSDQAPTLTEMAAIRGKIQVEDAATYTNAYGCLVEHEAVTGAKLVTAAFGAKSGASAAFQYGIDLSRAILEVSQTNEVVLFKFKDSGGTIREVRFDVDNATVLEVAVEGG